MASTYTANLGVEKPGSGEQAGTWGTTTNTNFDILDRAVSGVATVTLSGTTHTLTTTDGALSEGGNRVLVLGGSPSGTNTITIDPNDQDKFYLVKNGTDQTATFTQGSGGNVNVIAGEIAFIFADGAGSGAAVTKVNVGAKLGDDLDVNGKSIVTTSNGNIVLAPNGTGDVQVDADTLRVGDADADATITTNGTGDLTLSTNSGTNSGTIVIADGANGDITVAPNGTGKFTITGSNIVFEGATADDHETTFAVTDPTADRTITFPDASGTVALSADVSSAVPAGTVLVTARSSAPTGYLLCDGASVSRSTYSDLFSAIGTTYGSVDSNTFNVPDLRGRVVAGRDDMGGSAANRITSNQSNSDDAITGTTLGDTGGDEVQDLQETHLPAHTHSVSSISIRGNSPLHDGSVVVNGLRQVSVSDAGQNTTTQNTSGHSITLANTGSGTAVNNMQPTMILNYMIKT